MRPAMVRATGTVVRPLCDRRVWLSGSRARSALPCRPPSPWRRGVIGAGAQLGREKNLECTMGRAGKTRSSAHAHTRLPVSLPWEVMRVWQCLPGHKKVGGRRVGAGCSVGRFGALRGWRRALRRRQAWDRQRPFYLAARPAAVVGRPGFVDRVVQILASQLEGPAGLGRQGARAAKGVLYAPQLSGRRRQVFAPALLMVGGVVPGFRGRHWCEWCFVCQRGRRLEEGRKYFGAARAGREKKLGMYDGEGPAKSGPPRTPTPACLSASLGR